VPHYAAIGNHDVLGWHGRRRVAVDDPDLGKGIIINRLGLPGRYYSFDHGGWHFVVLDSIHPVDSPENGPVYEPRIGEEQLHWLAHDLGRNTGKPTVVMTHIAAFCALGQINGDASAKAISPMVLADTRDLRHILERHKVKALLQGHSHIEEDYKFRGVWYLTSAAVSGCWWSGTWKGFSQGYTLLHARGEELSWERVVYPWTHVLEPEDNLERERIAEWEAFEAEQRRLLAAEIAAS
jgi:3',5'-cyclic AMP phosphodiesterase CpdA